MPKSARIGYSFSGDANEYTCLLRKFRLDSLLIRISKESVAVMHNDDSKDRYGVKWTQYTLSDIKTRRSHKQDVVVTAWGLIDLAYEAIMASNDYRGRVISTDEELYLLISATSGYKAIKEKEVIKSFPERGEPDFSLYLWGFAGEQFKMQRPWRALSNASRELYILLELSKSLDATEDIAQNVIWEVRTTWRNVLISLFLLWCASMYEVGIKHLEESIQWDDDFCLNDFRRVLNRYTTTYKEIKESGLGRQILYTKPYIRTSTSGVISINCFLSVFLYEHSIMWIVRDYYNKRADQNFVSRFGAYFEQYFREVLDTYVESENCEKTPECNRPSADWKLCLGGHVFLVEQKSTILGLTAKQQESNVDIVRAFAERNIVKALHQLESTECELGSGKCIKIVLLYEEYLKVEILKSILRTSGVTDDGYYWLVTIDEMEMLLYQYKSNRALFDTIIAEKIKRETENSKVGCSLEQLLGENGIVNNQHLMQDKFQFYENIAQNEAEKRMRR